MLILTLDLIWNEIRFSGDVLEALGMPEEFHFIINTKKRIFGVIGEFPEEKSDRRKPPKIDLASDHWDENLGAYRKPCSPLILRRIAEIIPDLEDGKIYTFYGRANMDGKAVLFDLTKQVE